MSQETEVMKISIITATYNSQQHLESCIKSVIAQKDVDLEYIIVDGQSTDQTLAIINQYKNHIAVVVSEKDNGIYDALNKGLAVATGEVIGILHSDDFFPNDDILKQVVNVFEKPIINIVYGNLDYVDRADPQKIIRKWRSKPFHKNLFNWGWMPAHPTFYARKNLFKRLGNYNLTYKSAADYDLMLRFMYKNLNQSYFLNKTMVKMRVGGLSNQSFRNRWRANREDLQAMKNNGLSFPYITVVLKPLRKLTQFFASND